MVEFHTVSQAGSISSPAEEVAFVSVPTEVPVCSKTGGVIRSNCERSSSVPSELTGVESTAARMEVAVSWEVVPWTLATKATNIKNSKIPGCRVFILGSVSSESCQPTKNEKRRRRRRRRRRRKK